MQTLPGLKYKADKGHDQKNTVQAHVICCHSPDSHAPMPVSTQEASIRRRQLMRWRDAAANVKLT